MGCKPSTLGPRGRPSEAVAAGLIAAAPAPTAYTDAAGTESAALDSPRSGFSQGNAGSSLRLRLASLKPDMMMKSLSSPRQTLASGYDKLKKGASSLRQAITPHTTPGASPREEVTPDGPGGPHSIASNAIKEADNPACLDVAETKSQAVTGTMHTVVEPAGEKRHEGEDVEEADILNADVLPSPQQLKALWILMKLNAASSSQQSMRWLHDLEVLLVGLDPIERQQPSLDVVYCVLRPLYPAPCLTGSLSIKLCSKSTASSSAPLGICPALPTKLGWPNCVHPLCMDPLCLHTSHHELVGTDFVPFSALSDLFQHLPCLASFAYQTRSILVEAKALEVCLRPLTSCPEETQLCVSSLAIIVHLCMAKEASERLQQLGGIDITAKILKKYFAKAKKVLKEISLMHPETPEPSPTAVPVDESAAQAAQEQPNVQVAAAVEGSVESCEAAVPAVPQNTPSVSTPMPASAVGAAESASPNTPGSKEEAPEVAHVEAAEPAEASGQAEAAAAALKPAAAAPEQSVASQPEASTKAQGGSNGQMAALKRACSKLQQQLPLLLQQKLGTATDVAVSQEQYDSAVRELRLLIEFMTLVWRLVFATSLDGDEFAQRWASLGVPELALEALSSQEAPFQENGFVCWGLGALRFIPLAVPSVTEAYVQSKSLLAVAFDRMELYPRDPLVLENGLAVLANYQRKQPNNSRLFSRQRPEAWSKCVSWLLEDASLSRIDVLFQGLFALGLACSYCPVAARRVWHAGGLALTDRVLTAHGDLPRESSSSSTTDSKLATLQQFAEGLKMLLLRAQEAEAAEEAAAKRAEDIAALGETEPQAEKAPDAEQKGKKESSPEGQECPAEKPPTPANLPGVVTAEKSPQQKEGLQEPPKPAEPAPPATVAEAESEGLKETCKESKDADSKEEEAKKSARGAQEVHFEQAERP
ncbi:hypothetical protein cyc_07317 [Cyclospora cayetanensis]|uniref:Uncharacterized protein n=1 Tax=Cyclospora cayetanensis TaxID=88456 RepID=A0A1D3CTP2_9EIME|nr:hypothetical protein cyc_07317 [Cyclospora cayetanensis]